MARRHLWFLIFFSVGCLLRLLTVVGYRPALWFPDSYAYLVSAMHPRPDLIRPGGYSGLLWLLEPLHSLAAVAVVQHLLGLATAVLVYVAARALRAPGWAATLAPVPVLLDPYQVELEHLLLSESLFMFLVTAGAVLALWVSSSRPTWGPRWGTAAAAGLAMGLATLTRTVALPLIAVLVAGLLIAGGRPFRPKLKTAFVAFIAAIIPIVGYMGWFAVEHGRFAISGANGAFLYARTMAFADCAVMRPPPRLAVLCDPTPAGDRPPSQDYIWSADSPLSRLPGHKFGAANNALAQEFAVRAILAQPGDYLATGLADLWRTFRWDRPVYPDQSIYDAYEFPVVTPPPPTRTPQVVGARFARIYERGEIATRVVEPYAGWLRAIQDHVRLPGPVLLAVLLTPVGAGLLLFVRGGRPRDPERVRRPRLAALRTVAPALIPWACAVVLVALPPMIAEFDYRYVLPAVPLACLAWALCFRPNASRDMS
ncbi:phospholipid carrier-dependent glycosyltransferase [Rhizohabitans arisaemae]|uniref:phospholipid carrier-dependent glycosyltransferase n=1 Tax=Rhizohabitans arisaemae TaxID=2720610 RepID=UPI0024B1234D|nr:phospholipid carrier-dependent glycosyltransferase [Rhizohabitans arisaemae]